MSHRAGDELVLIWLDCDFAAAASSYEGYGVDEIMFPRPAATNG